MKSAILCLFFMVLAAQYGRCDSLNYTFNNLWANHYFTPMHSERELYDTRELNVEAHLNENNNILITIERTKGEDAYFRLESEPFLVKENHWDTKPAWINEVSKSATKKQYEFYFSKTFSSTSLKDPCVKVDKTNDTVCLLSICSYLDDLTAYTERMLLYLRIQNTTGKPSLKIFGGMHEKSVNGNIFQDREVRTEYPYEKSIFYGYHVNLKLTFQNAEQYDIERVIQMENRNNSFLGRTRPQYMYIRCNKFQNLVSFTDESIRSQNVTVNLIKMGVPFDVKQKCTFNVLFTDMNSGNNLIAMPSDKSFIIGPIPDPDVAKGRRSLRTLIREAVMMRQI